MTSPPAASNAPGGLARRYPARAGRPLALLVTVGGLLGLLASTVLTYDRIQLLADPSFSPGCNINSVLSCGDVMDTWQSNVFGFPNMLLGTAAFGALTALGVVLLSGVALPRRLWAVLTAGMVAGFGFTVWLISQCLYQIHALCPWCMVVWAVMIPLAWYTVRHTAHSSSTLRGMPHWLPPLVLYAVVAGLVFTEFGATVFY